MRVEEKTNALNFVLDRILQIHFYFQIALEKQPYLIFFVILIFFGIYYGVKKLYFKKENDEEMNHKKLIFMFIFINLILLVWGYFIVFD